MNCKRTVCILMLKKHFANKGIIWVYGLLHWNMQLLLADSVQGKWQKAHHTKCIADCCRAVTAVLALQLDNALIIFSASCQSLVKQCSGRTIHSSAGKCLQQKYAAQQVP